METNTASASELLGNTSFCLICCSAYPKFGISANNLNSSTATDSIHYDSKRMTKATEKIFELLLVPTKHFSKVKKKNSLLSFCPNCMVIVQEIIELQKKAEILELQIKWKAETLGRIAIETPAFTQNNSRNQKEIRKVWKTFKAHVTRNFIQGLLPNPCVRLEKTVNVETKAMIQLGKHKSSRNSRTFKSTYNFKPLETETGRKSSVSDDVSSNYIISDKDSRMHEKMFKVVTEEGFIIPKPHDQDYDSDDDLFEEVTVSKSAIKTKETNGDTQHKEIFENDIQIAFQEEDGNSCDSAISSMHQIVSTRDACNKIKGNYSNKSMGWMHKNPVMDDSDRSSSDSNTYIIPPTNDISNEKVSVTKPSLGINGNVAQSRDASTFSISNEEVTAVGSNFENTINSEIDGSDEEVTFIGSNNRNSATDENFPPSLIDSTFNLPINDTCNKKETVENEIYLENTSESEEINQTFSNSEESIVIILEENNREQNLVYVEKLQEETVETKQKQSEVRLDEILQSALELKSNSRRGSTSYVNSTHSISEKSILVNNVTSNVGTLAKDPSSPAENVTNLTDDDELNKKLEGLIEGQDYVKCTKCNYFVEITQPKKRSLLAKLSSHYSSYHNTVERTNTLKTIDGKYCYKCTKCDFSLVFESNDKQTRYKFHKKLSIHYMSLHDVFESQQNSIHALCTEGIDYFLCAFTNCTFVALIKREGNLKQQFRNGIEARLKIIEHYGTKTHPKEHKDFVTAVGNPSLLIESANLSFYKCPRCGFKSLVGSFENRKTHFRDLKALKTLADHFLLEHIFPWDIFPGFYKYGCYEVQSENRSVLKCIYSDCNYFIKIQYDLEGRNQEQSRLVAYQLFVDSHAFNHSLNSIGINEINHVEHCPNNGQDVQLLGNMVTSHSLESNNSSDFSPLKARTDGICEEVTLMCTTNHINAEIHKPIKNIRKEQVPVVGSIPLMDGSGSNTVSLSSDAITNPPTNAEQIQHFNDSPERIIITIEEENVEEYLAEKFHRESFETKRKKMEIGTGEILRSTFTSNTRCTDDGDPCSTSSLSKRRKLDEIPTIHFDNINNILNEASRPAVNTRDAVELNADLELKGLIEGRDYLKCTKCDFYASRLSTNKNYITTISHIRQKVASHYGKFHNPVKSGDKFQTIDGNIFYKCTKCNFSIVFPSDTPSSRHYYHYHKLSSHYMEFHDAVENQSNSNTKDRLTSLTEGIDYFACPFINCTFVAFIKRDESQKQQFLNATEARLKLTEHFRCSRSHYDQRKETLSDIATMSKGYSVNFYQCKQCDFKSIVDKARKSVSPPPRVSAQKCLIIHFLLEHVFPWDSFPGFFKHGCYEEKCENGTVLKCLYKDCDNFVKLEYDLEGENKEEFQQEAYRYFFDTHGFKHNFNSIGFEHNDQCLGSSSPDQQSLTVDNFANEMQDTQLNGEFEEDNVPIFNEMVSEEIVVDIKPWFEEYEEAEEMDRAFIDSQ